MLYLWKLLRFRYQSQQRFGMSRRLARVDLSYIKPNNASQVTRIGHRGMDVDSEMKSSSTVKSL